MRSVGVSTGARLHLGLLDMAGFSGRKYGGIGCNLEEPRIRVVAHTTRGAPRIRSRSREPVTSALLHRLQTAVGQFLEKRNAGPVQLEIASAFQAHAGLGLGTGLMLASLKAAALARRITVTDIELITASGRGGTSGIGCNGFFSGGWKIDAGQPQDQHFMPSSASSARQPSLRVAHVGPTDWDVALFFPEGVQLSGEAELQFFKDATPVPNHDVAGAFPTLYHGLLPALLENDLEIFGQSLDAWNGLGFKKREIDAQSTEVQHTLSVLKSYAPAVGMSSLGPTVFAFAEKGTDWSNVSKGLGMRPLVTRVAARGWGTF